MKLKLTKQQNNVTRIFLSYCLFFGLITLFHSCYSPIDDCLDNESTNYSINADEMCENCCLYPVAKLNVFHQNDTETISLGDTIINNIGQHLVLLNFVYLLSDFYLYADQAQSFEVIDTIQILKNNNSEFIKDDVVSIKRALFEFELGTIIFDANVQQMTFKVGLNDDLNYNPIVSSTNGHPLTSDPDTLYIESENKYTFQRFVVAHGTNFSDTSIYEIDKPINISIPIEFVSERGKDKNIIIETLYDKWFDNINFTNMGTAIIESKIEENTKNVFRKRI
ncbi:MAG: hypothetical protein V3V14_01605 [Saprospiraceae bacterium]